MLYFDGSKYPYGSRACIVLVSPTNEVIPMAYNLIFECTNTMEEYETLILGLKVAITLRIKDLDIYGDSQLIINQVKDIFDTKYEKLSPYKVVVNDLLDQFDKYTI